MIPSYAEYKVQVTYSLSVYRMYCKQQSSYQSWPHLPEDQPTQLHVQVAHCTVQENFHQMVPHGLQLVYQIVQFEGSHTQRSVGLVTSWAIQRSPPEIMPE